MVHIYSLHATNSPVDNRKNTKMLLKSRTIEEALEGVILGKYANGETEWPSMVDVT